MKNTLKTIALGMMMLALVACGGSDSPAETIEDAPESANIGNLVSNNNVFSQGENHPDCPDYDDPVCTNANVQYRSSCDADLAGETEWQPC